MDTILSHTQTPLELSKRSRFFMRLFNVRPNEVSLVWALTLLQFFQGVGIAFFYSAAYSIFLSKYSSFYLAEVFILAGVLLFFFGWLYQKLEHSLSIKTLTTGIIIFMAGSAFLFRIGFQTPYALLIFIVLMLAWHRVIYTLANLEFWGLSAIIFDVRQSKRLFSLVSAGDIPAKLLGYLAVSLLVPYIGSYNLLYISGVAFLLSIIYLWKVLKLHHPHPHNEEHSHHHTDDDHKLNIFKDIQTTINYYFGNKLILYVALVCFMATVVNLILDYSFLTEVKAKFAHHNHSTHHSTNGDEELASFIAMFFAIGRVIGIFAKLILTGRITEKLGTRNTLLIIPIILILCNVIEMAFGIFTTSEQNILYLFGVMVIIAEVLKNIIQDPLILTVLQPLPTETRLKGHNVIKGQMDPFALLLVGTGLFAFKHLFKHIDLVLLSIVLTICCLIWIFLIFKVDKHYIEVLRNAIAKRFSGIAQLDSNDPHTLQLITDKISSNRPGEVFFAFSFLENINHINVEKYLVQLLNHPHPEVVVFALKKSKKYANETIKNKIFNDLLTSTDSKIKIQSIETLCETYTDEPDLLLPYLQSENIEERKSALVGALKSGNITMIVYAGQAIMTLEKSNNSLDKLLLTDIIASVEIKTFYAPLKKLLKDTDHNIVKEALFAISKVSHPSLLPDVFSLALQKPFKQLAITTLSAFGDEAIEYGKNIFIVQARSLESIEIMILLCGKINSTLSKKYLFDLFSEGDEIHHQLIIKSLSHINLTTNHVKEIKLIQNHIFTLIKNWTDVLAKQDILSTNPAYSKLAEALKVESEEILSYLFMMLCFIYDKRKVTQVEENLTHHIHKANALEYLENILPPFISQPLVILLDDISITEKLRKLKYTSKITTIEEIEEDIFSTTNHQYNTWTKAVSLYLERNQTKLKEVARSQIHHEPILMELLAN